MEDGTAGALECVQRTPWERKRESEKVREEKLKLKCKGISRLLHRSK